jgi:hypothetical protein
MRHSASWAGRLNSGVSAQMPILTAAVKCQGCGLDISPSLMDLLPDPYWMVSVSCRNCGIDNRIPWHISAALTLVSAVIAFSATALAIIALPVGVSSIVFALASVAVMLLLLRVFLLSYLRRSKRPFAVNRVGR